MPGTIEDMKAKSAKGMRTRQRILDAAIDLIQVKGVRATSVDDVLKASATGKSQFYHYFGSKDLMVREVIRLQAGQMPTDHDKILAEVKSIADLEGWLDRIVSDFSRGRYPNGCPIGTLASELATASESHRESLAKTFAGWEELLAKSLGRLKAKGMLGANAEPESLAMFIVSSVEGALLLAKTESRPEPIIAARDHIMGYLRALRNPGGLSGPKKRKSIGFCP